MKHFILSTIFLLSLSFLSAKNLDENQIRDINSNYLILMGLCTTPDDSNKEKLFPDQNCIDKLQRDYEKWVTEICQEDQECRQRVRGNLREQIFELIKKEMNR